MSPGVSMVRTCDAAGCSLKVATGRFMCYQHWRLVPRPLQRTINARYAAHKVARTLLRDAVYVDACAKAIEAVAAAEGQTPAYNTYRRLHSLLTSETTA